MMKSSCELSGKILVVDDTPASVTMVRATLHDAGYQVVVATSGEKAISRVHSEQPDLILLDILMPGIDGYEVCRRLKSDPSTCEIPIIFLSALIDTFDKVRGFELGAVDYLIKPISQEEMLARVNTHLTLSRLERDLKRANDELEERVVQRTTELAEANARLKEEILERKHAQEEITRKKDELYKAYEEMAAFDEELKANYDELSRVEKELRESEAWYRTLFENTGTATVILDEDTTVSLANDRFVYLTGYSREDLVGKKSWTEFVVPEDLLRMKEQHFLRRENPQKALTQYEFRLISRSGSLHDIFLTVEMIPGTKKSVASLLDITERKKAEKSLSDSEERFRALYDENPSMYLTIDPDGFILSVNQFGAGQLGYTVEDLVGRPVTDIIHQPDWNIFREHFSDCLSRKCQPVQSEYRKIRKDKSQLWVRETLRSMSTPDGHTIVLTVCENITEAKMIQLALDQATKKLGLLNNITFTGIQNTVFCLEGFFDLDKTNPKEAQPRSYLEKEVELVHSIGDMLKYANYYESLGQNPPRWLGVQQTFLYAISHLDYSQYSRTLAVEGVEIFADPLLEQVFFILSENVVRHARTATSINLWYQEIPDGIQLFFEDNGIGIPVDLKEGIFRKIESNKNMDLFLAREILAITDITIKETGGPGNGARFEITVPNGAFRLTPPDNP